MANDRLLSHKGFDMALHGTPFLEAEFLLDGAGTEGAVLLAPGTIAVIQNIVGAACFVSVGATTVEAASEPASTGLLLAVGDKMTVFTKEGRSTVRVVDNGTPTTVRVFSLS